MTAPLLFVRAGWQAAAGHKLSVWRVGTSERSHILVSKCAGMGLLHLLARPGTLIDLRTHEPANERALIEPTNERAAGAFRESIRRALKEIAEVSRELAAALNVRIVGNLAYVQFTDDSPTVITRVPNDSAEKQSAFVNVRTMENQT